MRSFWVSLSGWQRGREVRVQDGYAYFEVAEQGHCSICAGRIRNISAAAPADVKYDYLHDRYPSDGRALWAGVPVADDASNEDVIEKLKSSFSLPIIS